MHPYNTGDISIHPPRAGRDGVTGKQLQKRRNFNPPSPCGEGHLMLACSSYTRHFNPPSPCGEGLGFRCLETIVLHFNPPSPCGEGH